MKLFILVDQLHSHGGIEKLVALKANYWSTVFGYEVVVVATEQGGLPLVYPLDSGVSFVDLQVAYQRQKSYFSFANLLLLGQNIWRLQRLLFQQRPDVILVASHIPVTYVLPFMVRRKAILAKEFHYTKFFDSLVGIKAKVLHFIESRYDYLVVLSAEERRFYPSKQVVVIPNPIVDASIHPITPVLERPTIAVALLRFAPVKRLELLVAVWSLFSKQHPDWQLHLYGSTDTAYAQTIQALVLAAGLERVVLFKGSTSAVSEVLDSARLLLLTSEQECFPMVLLEAFAAGVPVVAFDCPTGPRNIVHNGVDGFLVPFGSVSDFVERMEMLVGDAALLATFSANAQVASLNYSVDSVMNVWNSTIFAPL